MCRIIYLLLITLFIHPVDINAMFSYSFCYVEIQFIADSVPVLSEIIIEAKKKKIRINNDTTVFNVGAFRDGSEKKIEELIAKIPGMSVNPDNGMISYQGRTVEQVKIDGADLLGSNYVAGTRNISVELIDEIEAVINDPANPLMRSMQSGGKTILNLKTKNKSASSNGEIAAGIGKRGDYIMVADIQANLLRLSRRIKIFNVASFNNRGVNNGSFNYFSSVQQTARSVKRIPVAESFFDQLLPALPLEHYRYNINSMRMLNGNMLLQPGAEHHALRLNFFLMQDRQITGYERSNKYNSSVNPLATYDRFTATESPIQWEAELDWKKLLNRKIWMQYGYSIQSEYQQSDYTQLLNDSFLISGRLRSTGVRHAHTLDITCRFNDRLVLRSVLLLAHHRKRESLQLHTGKNDTLMLDFQTQQTETGISMVDYISALMIKQKNLLFDIESGFQYDVLPFYSSRDGGDNNINRQRQYHSVIYQSAGVTFNTKNITWAGKIRFRRDALSWVSPKGDEETGRYFFAEPSIIITQRFGSLLKCVHQCSMSNEPVSNKPLLHYPLFISSRAYLIHDVFPQLQRNIDWKSRLFYQNLFRQQNAQIGFQYTVTDKSFLPVIQIDQRNIITRMTVVLAPQIRWQMNGHYEFFLRKVSTNFIIDASAGRYNYYNQINTRQKTEHVAEDMVVGLQCNTSFRFPVNLFYKFSLNRNFIRTEGIQVPGNNLLSHTLRLIWRKGKILFVQASAEAVRAYRQRGQTHLFFDLLMSYKPTRRNYAFTLIGKNLFNQRYFTQVQVSDYGRVLTQTRLLPAYLMLQAEYRF